PRGQRDPEPTDLAAAKRAVATAAAMTQESRPASRHAELLAALRTRLGLAADATEATIVAAIDKVTAGKRAARRKVAAPKPAQVDDAYPAHWTEAGRARLAKAHAAQLDDPSTRYPENWKR
ncbi:MAG: phage protease, partial [Acidobacteriota bacterium]|nr:phage protease [Acidobacteriota bacterium]